MRYLMIFALLLGVGALTVLAPNSAYSKTVSLCNASPVNAYFAIAREEAPKSIRTDGWYHLKAGECSTWKTKGNKFYYYGNSGEKLARWLNDGHKIEWNSWFNRYCIDPNNKFDNWLGNAKCNYKTSFKRVSLWKSHTQINVYQDNHKGIALKDAEEHRRRLIGRMNFENKLKANQYREPPFSVGAEMRDTTDGNGVEIVSVFPGMPAESLGLVKGDKIVSLNNIETKNLQSLLNTLDSISIFGHDPIPFSIVSVYDGKRYDGLMEPIFFPFNHKDYHEGKKVSAFGGSFVDGALFSLSSEVFCGLGNSIGEGIRSFMDDDDFNTKKVLDESSRCANTRDRELLKDELLYADAANAGAWASLIVPGIPLAKAARLGKAVPLAAKSRKVSRPTSTQRLNR